MIVIGYHGCDERVAESLLSGSETFEPSANVYDWLGAGIYFYENSLTRAKKFAEYARDNPGKFTSRGQIKTPVVIGAVIELGNCLDLTNASFIDELRSCYEEIHEYGPNELTSLRNGINKDQPEKSHGKAEVWYRPLDRSVINYLHHRRDILGLPPYDTVRGAFEQGDSAFPNSCIQEGTHIQIAVRSPDQIMGLFRLPRELSNEEYVEWVKMLSDTDEHHYRSTSKKAGSTTNAE